MLSECTLDLNPHAGLVLVSSARIEKVGGVGGGAAYVRRIRKDRAIRVGNVGITPAHRQIHIEREMGY